MAAAAAATGGILLATTLLHQHDQAAPALSILFFFILPAVRLLEVRTGSAAALPLSIGLLLAGILGGGDIVHPSALLAGAAVAGGLGALPFAGLHYRRSPAAGWYAAALGAAGWVVTGLVGLTTHQILHDAGAGSLWTHAASLAASCLILLISSSSRERFSLSRILPQLTNLAPGMIGGAALAIACAKLWRLAPEAIPWLLAAAGALVAAHGLQSRRLKLQLARSQRLTREFREVLAAISHAVSMRDRPGEQSPLRVQKYALGFASALNVNSSTYSTLEIASLVHDIGKLGVPERILGKRSRLSAEEFVQMQRHVDIGASILRVAGTSLPIARAVEGHHERWDGRGYPHGLRGEQIPFVSRILAIADMYAALTSERPHRQPQSPEDAVSTLRAAAGKQLDPNLVERFIAALPDIESGRRHRFRVRNPDAESNEALLEIASSAAEMAAVCRIAPALAELEELDDAMRLLAREVVRLLHASAALIYVSNPDGSLTLRGAEGPGTHALDERTLKPGEGISGKVAFRSQTRNGVSAAEEAAALGIEARWNSVTATSVPVRQGPSMLGVLTVIGPWPRGLPERYLSMLHLLADHAAGAIASLQRVRHSRQLALTDPLTGIANNRRLIAELERIVATPEMRDEQFCVVMMDLNGFKQVNDRLGHLAGDELLRDVARILQSTSGDGVLCGRYAGDEFVMLLPRQGPRAATATLRSISAAVDALSPVSGQVFTGISAGLACYPEDGLSGPELLARADQRMYEDKLSRKACR